MTPLGSPDLSAEQKARSVLALSFACAAVSHSMFFSESAPPSHRDFVNGEIALAWAGSLAGRRAGSVRHKLCFCQRHRSGPALRITSSLVAGDSRPTERIPEGSLRSASWLPILSNQTVERLHSAVRFDRAEKPGGRSDVLTVAISGPLGGKICGSRNSYCLITINHAPTIGP
jgi:hypothetical protein